MTTSTPNTCQKCGKPILEGSPRGLCPLCLISAALPVAPKVGDPTLTAGREPNRGYEGLAISPDGKFAYAMLQNGTIGDGYDVNAATRGPYTRIVKYDVATGVAVGQYA